MPALAAAYVRGTDLAALGAVGDRRVGVNDPVETTDRFHLGSCTKSMTATLIARLVEQGLLDWKASVAEIFPDLRKAIHPGYRAVTLVQLLSHRAGMPYIRGPDRAPLRALAGPLPEQRRTVVASALRQAPASEPGSRFEYSNVGYLVAGAMAEQTTGQAWEELMRRLVFGPLGMTTAGFGAPGRGQPWGHVARGCEAVSFLRADADIPEVLGPNGTVHSTLADWAAYASLHLQGAQGQSGLLLKPASFAELHRDHFAQGWALGWELVDRAWARGRTLTHRGSNGLWYAVIWIAPSRNVAFLAATNCGCEEGRRACGAAGAAMIKKFL